jgi:mRNA interferase MazF
MIKGEIWWADLPRPIGSVPGKRRPVLIIQNDQINKSTISTVIVAAITSNIELSKVPGNLLLEKNDSNLGRRSVINFSQIVTIDKTWLTEMVGMLNKATIKLVDEKLKLIFDIE